MKESKRKLLKELIRELIHEEMNKIKEASTTANVAGYSTPYAFSGDEDEGERENYGSDDPADYGLGGQGYEVVDDLLD